MTAGETEDWFPEGAIIIHPRVAEAPFLPQSQNYFGFVGFLLVTITFLTVTYCYCATELLRPHG